MRRAYDPHRCHTHFRAVRFGEAPLRREPQGAGGLAAVGPPALRRAQPPEPPGRSYLGVAVHRARAGWNALRQLLLRLRRRRTPVRGAHEVAQQARSHGQRHSRDCLRRGRPRHGRRPEGMRAEPHAVPQHDGTHRLRGIAHGRRARRGGPGAAGDGRLARPTCDAPWPRRANSPRRCTEAVLPHRPWRRCLRALRARR